MHTVSSASDGLSAVVGPSGAQPQTPFENHKGHGNRNFRRVSPLVCNLKTISHSSDVRRQSLGT